MKKYAYLFLALFMIIGLVACGNEEEQTKEPVQDAEVDPSAKNSYKDAMTQLFLNDNVAPLADVSIKIDGTEVAEEDAMEILKNELKEHKYVQEYFNLVYYFKAFEKQSDDSYRLDVTLEFSDDDNIYLQEHQVTFTGEPGNFKMTFLEIKTGD
jgi:hypothetical protein